MGVEHRPKEFFDQFDNSQGGNILGKGDLPLVSVLSGEVPDGSMQEEIEQQLREIISRGWTPSLEEIQAGVQYSWRFGEEDRKALAKIGQLLTDRIDDIDPTTLTTEEFAIARYYRYSLAVSLMGERRSDYLMTKAIFSGTVRGKPDIHWLKLGAKIAAKEYMQNFPVIAPATVIRHTGMISPDYLHQDFFMEGLHRSITQYACEHNPSYQTE